MNKLSEQDPIQAYQRKATATRRIGKGKQCACGEQRPEALIAGTNSVICAACERKNEGKNTMDNHHVFGKSNDPTTTIPINVNDHRAELSVAQHDWPKETLENPDRSPLLAGAAKIRGFTDTIVFLIEKGLLWIAEMLEALNGFLVDTLGQKWWIGTPLAQFAPKG